MLWCLLGISCSAIDDDASFSTLKIPTLTLMTVEWHRSDYWNHRRCCTAADDYCSHRRHCHCHEKVSHCILVGLMSESLWKGSNVPSVKSPMVNEEGIRTRCCDYCFVFPSVIWHRRLSGGKDIRPVETPKFSFYYRNCKSDMQNSQHNFIQD